MKPLTARRNVLAAGLALACATAPSLAGGSIAIGEPAPDFTLTAADGSTHSLSEYRGKFVVLEWINFDCPFVKKHYNSGNMPALQKALVGQGVVWLSINSSAPGKQGYFTGDELAERIAQAGHAGTAYLLDSDGTVGRAYGAKTTPHMFVIDPRGVVVYAGGHESREVARPVDAALEDLLAGRPVKVTRTKNFGCSVKYAKP